MNLLKCRFCSYEGEPDLGWQVFGDGTTHLRAECRKCGRYIQYLPQADSDGDPTVWVLAAPTKPSVAEDLGQVSIPLKTPWYPLVGYNTTAIAQEIAWANETSGGAPGEPLASPIRDNEP